MKRVGVVTGLNTSKTVANAAGELLIKSTDGEVVTASVAGPYAKPGVIELSVGLGDGTSKALIAINPYRFKYSVLPYVAAVGKTISVGYTGSANKLIVVDPTSSTNVGKIGTLSVRHIDLASATSMNGGETIQESVQIAVGETVTTLYVKLQAIGTKIAAAINERYGSGTVTFTSGSPVLNAASSYLRFAFAANKLFTVTLDGIFDGTIVTTTAGATAAAAYGLLGSEVRELELEAAVLDGFNPNQMVGRESFDVSNYVRAVAATGYDSIIIETKLDAEYESPDAPTGWDVFATIYSPNTTPGTVGAPATSIVAILEAVRQNHTGLTGTEVQALVDVSIAAIP